MVTKLTPTSKEYEERIEALLDVAYGYLALLRELPNEPGTTDRLIKEVKEAIAKGEGR